MQLRSLLAAILQTGTWLQQLQLDGTEGGWLVPSQHAALLPAVVNLAVWPGKGI
jgi:hypothetical protein